MGKKNRRKYKYTKHEFIQICCSKCKICNEKVSPDLCYSKFYLANPKKFIKVAFKRLLKIKRDKCYTQTGIPFLVNKFEHLRYIFKDVFCNADLCDDYYQCDSMSSCLLAFSIQTEGVSTTNTYTKLKRMSKKKKHRYVAKPYPSFFTNDNETFHKEIKDILGKN